MSVDMTMLNASNMQVDDAVDRQLEQYIERMLRYGFKPCEGLTQGYLESQRIFSRIGLVLLAIAEAITQEDYDDTASTDDNILRTIKTIRAYTQPYGLRRTLGDVPEVSDLASAAKERNCLYPVSFDDYSTKSIAWCVASLVRTFVVGGLYGVNISKEDDVVTTLGEYVEYAKAVHCADYDIHSFNYGSYARGSKPLYARRINNANRAAAGTIGPMDNFVGGAAANRAARPDIVQRVVDQLACTQDTLSELVAPGKLSTDNGVSLLVVSAYDAVPDGSQVITHVSALCGAIARIQPDSTYNHKASPYEQNNIFFNAPRNIRGQCIYKYSRGRGSDRVSEVQHKVTNQSYLEDVACGAIGFATLMRRSNIKFIGNGNMLQYALDECGILKTDGVHIDEHLLLSIVKRKYGDGEQAPTTGRTTSAGKPLLEDVITNSLLSTRISVSRGIPTACDEEAYGPDDMLFCAVLDRPDKLLDESDIDAGDFTVFFTKVVGMALSITDSVSHTAPGYIEALMEYILSTASMPQADIDIAYMYQHESAESNPDAVVVADSEPRRTIGNSIVLEDGTRLTPEAYHNIAMSFMKPLADVMLWQH